MIYECPSCHTPQAAGQTSCPHCGADFEGPVPDDAVVPEPSAVTATGENTPSAQEPPPTSAQPPVEALPYQAPPPLPAYQPPPAYAAPPAYQAAPPPQKFGVSLPKPVLIGVPIVLLLVLGGVLFTRNLDSGSDSTAPPAAAPAATTPAPAPVPAPVPTGPPVTLSGGGATSSNGSNAAKFLVGRWQTKSTDFFVFNDNGTGSQGSITGKQSKAVFVWVLSQNQLILYADKQEKLSFSPGSDDDSMFLKGEDGKYVEYRRTKTNA